MSFRPELARGFGPVGGSGTFREQNGPHNSWFLPSNGITRILGFSFIASLLRRLLGGQFGGDAGGSMYFMDSIMLFVLGSLIEGGRRLFSWAIDRFKLFREF